jgi:hypothetical protein
MDRDSQQIAMNELLELAETKKICRRRNNTL